MYLTNNVSRAINLSQGRAREYKKKGFIKPRREKNTNNRLYSDFEVTQIQRINHLIHKRDFTLTCLRNLLVMVHYWNVFACAVRNSYAVYHQPHRHCYEIRPGDRDSLSEALRPVRNLSGTRPAGRGSTPPRAGNSPLSLALEG